MTLSETLENSPIGRLSPKEIKIGEGVTLCYGTEDNLSPETVHAYNLAAFKAYKDHGHITPEATLEEFSESTNYSPENTLYIFLEKDGEILGGLKTYFNDSAETFKNDSKSECPVFDVHCEYGNIEFPKELDDVLCMNIVEIGRLFISPNIRNLPNREMAQILPSIIILALGKIVSDLKKEYAVGIIERRGAARLVEKTQVIGRAGENIQSYFHTFEAKEGEIDLTKVPDFLSPYFKLNKGIPFFINVVGYYANMTQNELIKIFLQKL